ncbi:MAG: hypothetical protein ACYC8T_10555 [Myxococcaceae bacterium]
MTAGASRAWLAPTCYGLAAFVAHLPFAGSYGFFRDELYFIACGNRLGAVPQHFADQFGWEELARAVSEVYQRLPAAENNRVAVWAGNYGEAGALELYSRQVPLPPVLSGHNSYFLWGPGAATGEVMIVIGEDEATLRNLFDRVELARTLPPNPYVMPYESGLTLHVCRGPKTPLATVWPSLQHYE